MADGHDQQDQDHQGQVFELGLSLAGAISAGAYTAGVIDFLVQALSEWDAHRGEPGVAGHRVVLKVITGASAGAIAGALGVIALARGLKPRAFTKEQTANRYPDLYPAHQEYECVLPSLHHVWVDLPAMVSGDGGNGGLLGTADVAGKPADGARMLRSLLNASLLDDIKRAAIEEDAPVVPPVPFVATRLHVYMTLSNMRGIPFEVAFGRSTYGMQTIGDRVHYVVGDLGASDLDECGWLARDSKASLPLSVKTLPQGKAGPAGRPARDPYGVQPPDWDIYGATALASGAFPGGLASRQLSFAWEQYRERSYPVDLPDKVEIRPKFPASATACNAFTFECVDGGLVNNNPFDYAQYALTGARHIGPAAGKTASQAIVMVAPFPEPPAFPPQGTPSSGVVAIVKALLPALLNQARFRAGDLTPAVNENDFSRFVIAPLRRIPRMEKPKNEDEDVKPELYPIACGLLGGFGGFLHRDFRAHDFQLGRRNCQQFLRSFFWVPSDNLVVGGPVTDGRKLIIPLVGDAAKTVPMPRWPKMKPREFDDVCDRMKARIAAVAPVLIRAETSGWLWLATSLGWRFLLRKKMLGILRAAMLAELVRHRQIEGFVAPPSLVDVDPACKDRSRDDVQAVIAELLDPDDAFKTPADIAAATHLPPAFVAAVLSALLKPGTPPISPLIRTWTDGKCFSLYDRRPWHVKILSRVGALFGL
jgi:Patatin-like phospholipase